MKDHCRSGYRFTIPNHRQQWQVSYKWFPKVLVLPLLWVKKEKNTTQMKAVIISKKKINVFMFACTSTLSLPGAWLIIFAIKVFHLSIVVVDAKKNEWWLTYMYNLKIKTTYSEKRVKYKRSSFFQIKKILKARLLFCVFNHIS